MSKLAIELLGPFQVTRDRKPVAEFEYEKVRALLAYLVVESSTPLRRETLRGLLWPEMPEPIARNNLRQALFSLRQTLQDRDPAAPWLYISRETAQFNPTSAYTLDVNEFSVLLQQCKEHRHRRVETCMSCIQRLQQVDKLYRGEFLSNVYIQDSAPFEEWVLFEREALRQKVLGALSILANYFERRRDFEHARQYAWRQVELDTWREDAYRQLMRILALNGQRSMALAQYETCRRILAEEMGIEPSAETKTLYEQIRTETLQPTITNAATAPHNLPAPINSFIGRKSELAQVIDRLQNSSCRLLTLVGPGGVGKTRLALEAAAYLVDDFQHGLFYVRLGLIRDPHLVIAAMARVLRLAQAGTEPLFETLKNYLRDREILLILDNFEQVIDAAADLTELLNSAPRLTLMVTSRKELRVYGENLFAVRPLALPDPEKVYVGNGDAWSEAMAFFAERAHAACKDFALTRENARAVAAICLRLDGLPLALELAAASLSRFSPEEILGQLDHRLTFLRDGPRDLAVRQQTLQNTMDWSYDLLDKEAQTLFARFAVFARGSTEEAATFVCGGSEIKNLAASLHTLVAENLLQDCQLNTGEPYFAMLETIREYAVERLKETDETECMRRKHAEFYMLLAERVAQETDGTGQAMWINRLEVAYDEMHQTLLWTIQNNEIAMALRLVSALGSIWRQQGNLNEGKQWLARGLELSRRRGAVATSSMDPLALQGHVLLEAGMRAMSQADYASANLRYQEAMALWRELGDQQNLAVTLESMGLVALVQSQLTDGESFFREGACIWRDRGEKQNLVYIFQGLASIAAIRGDWERSARLAGFAEAQKSLGNMPDQPEFKKEFDQAVALARDKIDADRFAAVRAEGSSMTLEGATDYALG